jgi:hypothetical protein
LLSTPLSFLLPPCSQVLPSIVAPNIAVNLAELSLEPILKPAVENMEEDLPEVDFSKGIFLVFTFVFLFLNRICKIVFVALSQFSSLVD